MAGRGHAVRFWSGAPGGGSSAGRAPPRQGGGRGVIARHPLHAALAQLAEALRPERRGSGSESRGRHEGGRTGQACRAPLLADARREA